MPAGITTTAIKFRFKAIDIRSINPRDLLASPAMDDAIMAVLCEGGGSRDTVRRILSRLRDLEQRALNRAYDKLLQQATLRRASEFVERDPPAMNIHIDLDEINNVREHSDRKARAAKLELLGDMIATKFGLPPTDIGARLWGLGDEDIKAISLHLGNASSFEELLAPGSHPAP